MVGVDCYLISPLLCQLRGVVLLADYYYYYSLDTSDALIFIELFPITTGFLGVSNSIYLPASK